MKKLLIVLALLSPVMARANTVTPQFTTGSMNSTTTTTQTIVETEPVSYTHLTLPTTPYV